MGNLNANYQDNVSVIAPVLIARNSGTSSVKQGTLDLRTGSTYSGPLGAEVNICIGRTDTTALSSGIDITIYREIAATSVGSRTGQRSKYWSSRTQLTAANVNTVLSGTNGINAFSLTVGAYTQANLTAKDWFMITNSGFGSFTRLEFVEASYSASTTSIILATDTCVDHASNADVVINKADVYTVHLEPGALYTVSIDYGPQTTGGSVVAAVIAQVELSLTF